MLRELSLRTTAEQVGNRAAEYRRTQGLEQAPIPEKVMVCLSTRPGAERLLRVARALPGAWRATGTPCMSPSPTTRATATPKPITAWRSTCAWPRPGSAGGFTRRPQCFRRAYSVRSAGEHIACGLWPAARSRWDILLRGSVLNRFLSEVRDVTVQVVPMHKPQRKG